MAGSLQNRLGDLALAFSEKVLEAIRGTSLEELFGDSSVARRAPANSARSREPATARRAPAAASPRESGPAPAAGGKPRGLVRGNGRLSRRSTTDIARIVSEIVSLLGEHAGGLRAEQIREHLGLVAKELPRPLKEGLDSGKLGKAGQKRATTYFLAGSRAGATKPPSKGRGRPAAPKGAGGAGKARKAAGVASKKSAKKSAAPKRRK
jgi:hypothetical protein